MNDFYELSLNIMKKKNKILKMKDSEKKQNYILRI